MKIKSTKLTILQNKKIAHSWYLMTFSLQNNTNWIPTPGQFISISLPHHSFRRPFAVSNYKKDTSFSILYQTKNPLYSPAIHNPNVDNATTFMSSLNTGSMLEVMGFHGNQFPFPSKNIKPILVAGGIGLGPLLYFAQCLLSNLAHNANTQNSPLLIVGAKTANAIPHKMLEGIENIEIKIATDDGSQGIRGTSIDVLEEEICKNNRISTYFCGPLSMMRVGATLMSTNNIQSYSSLDSMMACAMGACVACVAPIYSEQNEANTKAPSSYSWKKTCTQGPIFNNKDIAWEQIHEH